MKLNQDSAGGGGGNDDDSANLDPGGSANSGDSSEVAQLKDSVTRLETSKHEAVGETRKAREALKVSEDKAAAAEARVLELTGSDEAKEKARIAAAEEQQTKYSEMETVVSGHEATIAGQAANDKLLTGMIVGRLEKLGKAKVGELEKAVLALSSVAFADKSPAEQLVALDHFDSMKGPSGVGAKGTGPGDSAANKAKSEALKNNDISAYMRAM